MANDGLTHEEFSRRGANKTNTKYSKEQRSEWARRGGEALKLKDPNHFRKMAEASKVARAKKKLSIDNSPPSS